ncbi:hypothetical protein P8935_09070 [Telmatobacter sp. DSM 110680]|uniref:Uncharacterized protein n=1 Tax=Telmatobacter sp. DSM 110680 TaxID=3036704 RepID=A0AAU7DQ82_9BACT
MSAPPINPRRDGGQIERLYARALRLYPAEFSDTYAPAMRQALRDALSDKTFPLHKLIPLIFRDLVTSLIKEHIDMLPNSLTRPALIFNALILAGIATGVALALYAIPQHLLRSGLNDPQIQLAGDVAARIEQGVTPADAIPASQQIDMARSLSPFVIVYDEQRHPIASQGLLNGSIPTPPPGVFENVLKNGEERLSWQPVRGSGGVRIAAVIQRVNGPHTGYVLAGRNMREVEARIADVQTMAGLTWLGMLGLIMVGTITFAIYTRPSSSAGPYHGTTSVAP